MPQREHLEQFSSSCPQPIVVVQQVPSDANSQHKGKGYYAENLAFNYEDEALLPTRIASDVYSQLSQPQPVKQHGEISGDETDGCYAGNQRIFWKTVVLGCMLATSILVLYLWIHIRYVNPMFIEIFKISAPSHSTLMPKISHTQFIEPAKSDWRVDYDLPEGIPVIKLHAKDVTDLVDVDCPPSKFALALHLESDSELAENWLKACGYNVAYFRIDGNPTQGDVERLIIYLKNAQFLPLKATLRLEEGGDLLSNPDFQETRTSDEVIKSVEISGNVTPKTIEQLLDAVPYAEELTITGSEVCKSLRRSLKTSEQSCQVTWQILQKLSIVETHECRGLYDLIYSCWDMPQIEILQIRKSIISNPNSEYIKAILDHYRIMKVDFADNVCFDEALQNYPFMCQAS